MASLAPIPQVPGDGFLPALRGAQPAGPCLAHPALPPLRRPASRGTPPG